jgi:hypothetical protein
LLKKSGLPGIYPVEVAGSAMLRQPQPEAPGRMRRRRGEKGKTIVLCPLRRRKTKQGFETFFLWKIV